MPNLVKRGEIWWYTFTVDGRRVRRSAKTPDRRLAEDIATKDEWRHRHAAVHGAEAVLTFGDAMALYVAHAKDNRFLTPLLDRWAKVRVRDITPAEIRRSAAELYPGRSPATWNRQVVTPTRAIINYAAECGYCPFIRVKRFPEPVSRRKAGDRLWLAKFRAACHAPNLAALARFMFETGARIGEAVALTWEDMDLQSATATFGRTKNGEPHTVHLSPGMVVEIANLDTSRKVFGYSSRHTVAKQWNRTIEKAGIDKRTPHEAGRHGFATELIVRHGVDIPTTAKMGNWKSHRLLSETYAHPEHERETVRRIFGTGKR